MSAVNSAESTTSSPRTWSVGTLIYTRAGLTTLFFWLLLGGFGWVFKDRCTPSIVQLLLSDFGASDNFTSILIGSLPWAMALFVFPIVGYYSDRYRSPLGRRIPFLVRTIPIVAISMPGLTLSPWLGSVLDQGLGSYSPGLNGCVLIFLSIFWGFYQFADILGNSLIGALVNDVVPQAVIGRFFGGYRAVGLIPGMFFNFYLFNGSDTTYVPIFCAFGIVSVFTFSLMCMKIEEGHYPPPPPVDTSTGALSATREYFQECFGSSYYWLVFVTFAISTTMYSPVNYFSTFFTRDLMTPDLYGKLLALTFAISFVLAYPLGLLADRFHPIRVGIVVMILYATVTLWGGFFARTPEAFNVAFVLHGVMAGSIMTSTLSLLQRLLPRMKFAQFASAAGIVACFCNILIGPVTGRILGAGHPDYRLTFIVSSVMAWSGVVLMIFLYRAFLFHGGDDAYLAPDDPDLRGQPAAAAVSSGSILTS